jgi:PAS domain S-box-containing protein
VVPPIDEEEQRVAAVGRYEILDTPPEPELDRITAMAAKLFRVTSAVIVITDRDRHWFKSRHGMPLAELPRALAFCTCTVLTKDLVVIPDALVDPRFAENILVTGPRPVRFYAGAPLLTPDGFCIGALAVMDGKARDLSSDERALLMDMAALVMDQLNLRQRSRSGARESERRLEFVARQLPAVLWTTDRDLRVTSAVGGAVTSLGFAQNQLVGVQVTTFLGTTDPTHPALAAHACALAGEGVDYDLPVEGRWFRSRLEPLRDAAGTVIGTIGVGLDVTEWVKAQEEVRERAERYRLISRATNDVVWDWNLATNEVVWSDALYTVFRYERAGTEAGGPRDTLDWWVANIHPADRRRVTRGIHGAIDGGEEFWSDEYRFARGDGSYALVYDRGFISRSPGGEPVRMVGSMLDITEKRQMEAQLVQTDRLASLGTLAAGVAHEINNPLTYVMANIGFVADRLGDLAGESPAEVEEKLPHTLKDLRAALGEAHEGATRVRQIVRDLKIFSRGQGDESRSGPVDIHKVLETAISMAGNEIKHRARLVKELGPVPLVEGNQSRLVQVFLNLLMNAAQAIPEGAAPENQIQVVTKSDSSGRAVVLVRDSGVGIPADVATHIFDPFFTTKPMGVGLGLGLFVCQGIIKSAGGELTVESTSPEGTTFRVALPAARPRDEASTGEDAFGAAGVDDQEEARGSPRLRVLVVDDAPQVARSLARGLAGLHDVEVASDGREALALLTDDRNDFDVVLCDVMMPDVSGVDLYQQIAARRPELAARFVFMTGGAFTKAAHEFLERVPNPRIDKPFEIRAVRRLLRNGGFAK